MASTFGYTFSVNVTGNLTNENITDLPKHNHGDHDHKVNLIRDKYKNAVVPIGSINAIFAIAVNLLLLVTILKTRAMRRSLFYWNVISLCVAGLLSGFIIIPFFTNKLHHEKWFHGAEFCQVFVFLEYTRIALPGTVFISMQIDRFIKVRMRVNPSMHFGYRILQYILFIFPWFFLFFICIPILEVGENDVGEFLRNIRDDYCIYILKKEHAMVWLYLMIVSPVTVLIVFSIVSLINFKLSESHWKRMSEVENESRDLDSTRSSAKATIVSTAVFLVLWLPFVLAILRSHICFLLRKRECFPTELEFWATYIIGSMSSYLRQLPWFILPDMCTSVMELAQCTYSASVRKMNDARKYFSRGSPLVDDWPTKQSELNEEKI